MCRKMLIFRISITSVLVVKVTPYASDGVGVLGSITLPIAPDGESVDFRGDTADTPDEESGLKLDWDCDWDWDWHWTSETDPSWRHDSDLNRSVLRHDQFPTNP